MDDYAVTKHLTRRQNEKFHFFLDDEATTCTQKATPARTSCAKHLTPRPRERKIKKKRRIIILDARTIIGTRSSITEILPV